MNAMGYVQSMRRPKYGQSMWRPQKNEIRLLYTVHKK